ncbi:hypothetical protein OPKNFCMD_6081 [Methylobacterium crusticola]|uniref:Uncharacterized protein n=1 Tax=Methylobacterium crusticola TaxID=1697972 RepID=A0ABQ4R7K6_9HYPH|nr:hypothetical protein OPKNFCMD_6081 [Methylobacterium crusticola]
MPATTLVIADTFGFHARGPGLRASTRVTVHTSIRRNPFLPWTGLDPRALPGLRGRELALKLVVQDLRRRLTGRGAPWRPVGSVAIGAPPRSEARGGRPGRARQPRRRTWRQVSDQTCFISASRVSARRFSSGPPSARRCTSTSGGQGRPVRGST